MTDNICVKLTERFPEEDDIVEFTDYAGNRYWGFYILPYRAFPNNYFDPHKLARWCVIDVNGNWYGTDIKPVEWKFLCKVNEAVDGQIMRGHYIKKGY